MAQSKEYTLPDLVREVAKELGIEKLFDSPEGRAAMAGIVNKAIADLETRMNGVIDEERRLRTAAEESVAELRGRLQRREAFSHDFGFHRGLDGRMQPNVSKETADSVFKMIRAMRHKNMDEVRAVSTGTGAEGGYLLQTEVATEVLRLIPELGLYPRLARPWPMGEQKVDIGSVLSQMGAYWPGENNAITESFPSFGKLTLEAKKCGALIPIPIELIDDATPNSGQLFTDLIREAIMKEIDRVGIAGRSVASGGSDVFDGLLYANSIVPTTLGTGKTRISDVDPDIFLTMQSAVPEGARENGSYLMETTVLDNVRKVKTSTGDYVNGHFYTPPTGTEPAKLWGKPVYETSRLPAYSTTSQPSKRLALYGNWAQWAIFGTRQELSIATSDVAGEAFKNCQLVIRGITRVSVGAFGPAITELETAAS